MSTKLQVISDSTLSLVGELGPKHADALKALATDLLETITLEGARRDQSQEATLERVISHFDSRLQALSDGLQSHMSAELREELANIKRCVVTVYIKHIQILI